MVHTGSARAGVDNLTKTLSVEWSKYSISVNAIAPGVIVSSGTDRYGEGTLENAALHTPLQRCGSTEECAHSILFLASDRAAGFVTGQTWYVDGGQSVWGDFFNPFAQSKL